MRLILNISAMLGHSDQKNIRRILSAVALILGIALVINPTSVCAGARRFTFVYEATTAAPGKIEFENWVTWKTDKLADSRFNEFDFRHEFEFGLTKRLQAGIY